MRYSDVKNAFFDHMIKMKILKNGVLKVLICVRFHPEELLVPKIWKYDRGVLRDEILHIWDLSG